MNRDFDIVSYYSAPRYRTDSFDVPMDDPKFTTLGVNQHFQRFHKSTESTLFHDPPSPKKCTLKNVDFLDRIKTSGKDCANGLFILPYIVGYNKSMKYRRFSVILKSVHWT